MKSNTMEDNHFEPTNYLETNLVIKEEPIENDHNLAAFPHDRIKLEKSGSEKESVEAKVIFKKRLKGHHECDVCRKIFHGAHGLRDFKMHLKTHQPKQPKKVKKKGPFACSECGKSLPFLSYLKRHMKKVHGAQQSAGIEPTNYLETTLVIKEEPIENDNDLIELTKNEIKLEESGSGKDHREIRGKVDAKSYKNSEPNNGSYICEPCSFRTISPVKWSHHLKSHHKCEDCGKEFNGVNGHRDFKTHLKSHQSKQCDVCGKEFNGLKFFRDFKQHLKTHQPKQVFPCSKCDRSFPFLSYIPKPSQKKNSWC